MLCIVSFFRLKHSATYLESSSATPVTKSNEQDLHLVLGVLHVQTAAPFLDIHPAGCCLAEIGSLTMTVCHHSSIPNSCIAKKFARPKLFFEEIVCWKLPINQCGFVLEKTNQVWAPFSFMKNVLFHKNNIFIELFVYAIYLFRYHKIAQAQQLCYTHCL